MTSHIPPQIGYYQIIPARGTSREAGDEPMGMFAQNELFFVVPAVDTRSDLPKLLKVLQPRYAAEPLNVSHFQERARRAVLLQHEHIARIFETGEADGLHFAALEWPAGGSLLDLWQRQGEHFSPDVVVHYIQQLAAGLDYAHQQGVLHGNIHLGQISFTGELAAGDTRALLAGFEEPLSLPTHTVIPSIDAVATLPGSYRPGMDPQLFTAPERLQPGGTFDHRSDIYSLGILAYLLLTSDFPYRATSTIELGQKILTEPPLPPEQINPDLAPGLAFVLNQALSKNPQARYESATLFAAALAEGATWASAPFEHMEINEPAGEIFADPEQALQRRTHAAGALLLVVLVALLALLFWSPPVLPPWARFLNGSIGPERGSDELALSVEMIPYSDADLGFLLSTPQSWFEYTVQNDANFANTDGTAQIFVQQIDLHDLNAVELTFLNLDGVEAGIQALSEVEPDLLAAALMDHFLQEEAVPFEDISELQRTEIAVGEEMRYAHLFDATLLDAAVEVRLMAFPDLLRERAFIVGSAVVPDQVSQYSAIVDEIFASFQLLNVPPVENTDLTGSSGGSETPSTADGTDILLTDPVTNTVDGGGERPPLDGEATESVVPIPTATAVATAIVDATAASAPPELVTGEDGGGSLSTAMPVEEATEGLHPVETLAALVQEQTATAAAAENATATDEAESSAQMAATLSAVDNLPSATQLSTPIPAATSQAASTPMSAATSDTTEPLADPTPTGTPDGS